MTATLGRPAWMTAPHVTAALDALEAAGGNDCARFVGGCVRNALIGRDITDIDVATVLTPEVVTAALKTAGVKAIPTGLEHGTVTAVSGGRPVEITTLRRDVATDGRRAVVAFTTDWGEDAQRRDFTLNALYARRDGTILDPTGQGVADARAGRIVFVGEAEQRLREDYLRCLRFFRFFAWYGQGPADAQALAACGAVAGELTGLAAERITAELLKLMAASDPREAVRLMQGSGVLAVVLPGPLDMRRFERLVEIDPDPVLRLAALVFQAPETVMGSLARLRLSNAQRDRLLAALGETPETTPQAVRAAVYRQGGLVVADRAKLAWGASLDDWGPVVEQAEGWTPPVFPLNGQDALTAGLPKGPEVGEALRALEDGWVAGDFSGTREELLAALRASAAS